MGDVDVISDILSAAIRAYPDSEFIQSLSHRYLTHGGLSKKQLEGLYRKAAKIQTINPGKLATLEAIILKRPSRFRSALPPATPLYEKDQRVAVLISEILERYPQHKRVLLFRSMYDSNKPLSAADLAELEKFHKLLVKPR